MVLVNEAVQMAVGQEQVRPAVVIEVDADHAERVVLLREQYDSRFLADVGEGAIAIIVVEIISSSRQPARSAGHRNAFVLAELSRTGLGKKMEVSALVDIVGD